MADDTYPEPTADLIAEISNHAHTDMAQARMFGHHKVVRLCQAMLYLVAHYEAPTKYVSQDTSANAARILAGWPRPESMAACTDNVSDAVMLAELIEVEIYDNAQARAREATTPVSVPAV